MLYVVSSQKLNNINGIKIISVILEITSILVYCKQSFRRWVLSPSSGGTYTETSSIDWAQLNKFPEAGERILSPKLYVTMYV
jgi:hypothetical protein